jgi:hypothetical protein
MPVGVGLADVDGSGPVTEVQRRVGVAVHEPPTPGAEPDPVVELEVGPVAVAAMMGLGRPNHRSTTTSAPPAAGHL